MQTHQVPLALLYLGTAALIASHLLLNKMSVMLEHSIGGLQGTAHGLADPCPVT